jgi:siroheme decarboxylase
MAKLNDIERAILNRIQSDFPITQRPFKDIGDELGISEEVVLSVVEGLKTKGIVRRIGGNVVPRKIGFVSTLCAARVPIEKLDSFTEVVNRQSGVTHNYIRNHVYNVWFTLIAPSMEIITENLAAIRRETGIDSILNLPSTEVFKIRAEFEV